MAAELPENLIESLLAGDRRALARAITLVESRRELDFEPARSIVEAAMPHAGGSLRLAVSGPPGVGKSSFIEALGLLAVEQGKKLAVLAVDPSSVTGGGSILGDKTRMERLSRAPDAYIRPSPTQGALGGIAGRTREAVCLCEAAGYNLVIVETVGVGQSEVAAASMVDLFVVLFQPNSGDELQGIKRGILELADALIVSKADEENDADVEKARAVLMGAAGILPARDGHGPLVDICSAVSGRNMPELWQSICALHEESVASGRFERRRSEQRRFWLDGLVHEALERRIRQELDSSATLADLSRRVYQGEMSPFDAVRRIESEIGVSAG